MPHAAPKVYHCAAESRLAEKVKCMMAPPHLTKAFVLLIPLLCGCTTIEPVAPFERGYLAEEGMLWEGSPRNAKLKGHVYTSKEASSGGSGVAGGGCGCN